MNTREQPRGPRPPAPVVTACFGHAGTGIGAEAFRQILIEVGADPTAPTLISESAHARLLERYGTTVMRIGPPANHGAGRLLVPRVLLADTGAGDPQLRVRSYPELFAADGHAGQRPLRHAASHWASARHHIRRRMSGGRGARMREDLVSLAPEGPRGLTLCASLAGGTGSGAQTGFLEAIKQDADKKGADPMVATLGLLADMANDPVVPGPAAINTTLALACNARYADCPILIDNAALHRTARAHASTLDRRSSIGDEIAPHDGTEGWGAYRRENLIASQVLDLFIASFTRETEWDLANYRTWLGRRARFVVPWLLPAAPAAAEGGPGVETLLNALDAGQGAVLFGPSEHRFGPDPTASACVLAKVSGPMDREHRHQIQAAIAERFPGVEGKQVITVRIPCERHEPASACVLVNTRGIRGPLLDLVERAEAAWPHYRTSYTREGTAEKALPQAAAFLRKHLA